MKFSVLIPIEKNINIDDYVSVFKPFCQKYKDTELIFVLSKNVDTKFFEKNKKYKALVIDKFSVNNAVEAAIPYINGENLLIADSLVLDEKIYLDLAANLKADNMIVNTRNKGRVCYFKTAYYEMINFFNRIYTNKEDSFANQTLQCIGKDIVDVIKQLPQRANVIKNSLDVAGCDYSTIEYKGKTSKTRLHGSSYILVYVFLGLLLSSALVLTLINSLTTVHMSVNIILSIVLIISLMSTIMCYPRSVMVARFLTDNFVIVEKINFKVTKKR